MLYRQHGNLLNFVIGLDDVCLSAPFASRSRPMFLVRLTHPCTRRGVLRVQNPSAHVAWVTEGRINFEAVRPSAASARFMRPSLRCSSIPSPPPPLPQRSLPAPSTAAPRFLARPHFSVSILDCRQPAASQREERQALIKNF